MKKLCIFVLLLMLLASAAFAESGTFGDNMAWDLTDGVLTVSGKGDMVFEDDWGPIVPWHDFRDSITAAVIEDGVTSIGDYAFSYCYNLKSISIPDSVISVGFSAFERTGLETCWLPDSITELGSYAFSYSSIESVHLSSSLKAIYCGTFEGCSNLKSVTIPEGVVDLGISTYTPRNRQIGDPNTFRYSGIEEIHLPESLRRIGDITFWDCDYLKEITIPSGVRSINVHNFAGCEKLSHITMPDCLKSTFAEYLDSNNPNKMSFSWEEGHSIDITWTPSAPLPESTISWDFKDGVLTVSGTGPMESYLTWESPWEKLQGEYNSLHARSNSPVKKLVISEGITSIGDCAFWYLTNLEEVTIPSTVTSIGAYAFSSCEHLKKIIIPEGVATISHDAFTDCIRLKEIVLPSSLRDIDFETDWYYYGTSTEAKDFQNIPLVFINYSYCNVIDYLSGIPFLVINVPSSQKNPSKNVCFSLSSNENAEDTSPENSEDSSISWSLSGSTLTVSGSGSAEGYSWYGMDIDTVVFEEGITEIGAYSFLNCDQLQKVIIPSSVSRIGSSAFEGCTALGSIVIPGAVKNIEGNAFQGCSSLSSITLEEGIEEVSESAFSGCSSLKNLILPGSASPWSFGNDTSWSLKDGVLIISGTGIVNTPCPGMGITSLVIEEGVSGISDYAFKGWDQLQSATVPGSVSEIGEGAFAGCTALSSVSLQQGIQSIGSYAFDSCSSLETITLPESLIENNCDDWLFRYCSSLRNIIYSDEPFTSGYNEDLCYWTLKDGVLTVSGSGILYGTWIGMGIESVVIEDGITFISESAFEDCTHLKNVTLPESIEVIDSYAFTGCIQLQEITIPGSAPIGEYAFSDCPNLTVIALPGSNAAQYAKDNSIPCKETISLLPVSPDDWEYEIVNDETVTITSYVGDETTVIIPDTLDGKPVTSIGDEAFWDCSSLTYIYISDGISSIGENAFCSCKSLSYIFIPDSITSIGEGAFSFCSSLTQITIPDSVTSIESQAFSACTALTNVSIPNSVTSIGSQAFYDCDSLTVVSIPDGVISIGEEAFGGCDSLTQVSVPASVTAIENNPFSNCPTLETIMVSPDNPNFTVADGVLFSNADKHLICCPPALTARSYTIPDGTASICDYAFFCCKSLLQITIPDGVTSIGEGAFSNCSSLTQITIPDSVTSIGEDAFYECPSLTIVTPAGSYAAEYAEENNIPCSLSTVHE